MSHRRIAGPATLALLLAACGAGDDGWSAARHGPLAGACPDPVVIQTEWNPEAEYGAVYQLVGPDPVVDAGAKLVRAPLVDGGLDTGVDVEVRVGGPAIGFQSVSAQLYEDPDVLLGMVNTDEAIRHAGDLPTVAVMAPFDVNPMMLMWDPAAHPGVHGIADLGVEGVTVVYYEPDTYMLWLVGEGYLSAEQLDGGYDGTPARFVAEGGAIAQQGFATAEPYIYEHEVPQWGRPVAFELVEATGYEPYPFALSVRRDRLEELRPCLGLLVPVLQRALVAFLADPGPTLELIVDLVDRYATGWVYSAGVAEYSVRQQLELGLVGNGGDATVGDLEAARVDRLVERLVPLLEADGDDVPDGLDASDLATDEFIDPSIGLPGG
ncbi:MAG: ABC transporter substrate-binding protein [Acidimicrobiales bacterium]|nr:ABC transporter substrate-binding protein [Acidimicrobiales bacterium]